MIVSITSSMVQWERDCREKADDGRDVYCQRNHIKKGHKLYPGTAVAFAIKPTAKSLEARKVRVV